MKTIMYVIGELEQSGTLDSLVADAIKPENWYRPFEPNQTAPGDGKLHTRHVVVQPIGDRPFPMKVVFTISEAVNPKTKQRVLVRHASFGLPNDPGKPPYGAVVAVMLALGFKAPPNDVTFGAPPYDPDVIVAVQDYEPEMPHARA